jgi:peptidoglycan/LPS O-acetylase OafA/YrhL
MEILINNPIENSYIFITVSLIAALISVRRIKTRDLFPTELTQELKGLAILLVIFSHIGYFLVSDHRFLFPLSIMAGVGVNLFLFLSGYGLSASALNKEYSAIQLYLRRLKKLFIPLWIVISVFFISDFFLLRIGYGGRYILQSFLGYFPSADLRNDLNSPLWYFTFTLFYFLIFPLIFSKKHPWVSAVAVYVISLAIVNFSPIILKDVMRLYQVHIMAFPLGMLVGSVFYKRELIIQFIGRTRNIFSGRGLIRKEKDLLFGAEKLARTKLLFEYLRPFIYYSTFIAITFFIVYTAIHSQVGQAAFAEELTSIFTMSAIIILFFMKRIEVGLLHIFGLYSYEIYLLHWPLLYRYEIFYKILPAWLATIFYLLLFLALGRGLKKASKIITNNLRFLD